MGQSGRDGWFGLEKVDRRTQQIRGKNRGKRAVSFLLGLFGFVLDYSLSFVGI